MSYLSAIEEGEYRKVVEDMSGANRDGERVWLKKLIEDAEDPYLSAGISVLKLKQAEEKLAILEEVINGV